MSFSHKKDLLLLAAVAALAAAAFAALRASDPEPPREDPYRPRPKTPVAIDFRSVGGFRGLERVEVEIRGPDDCLVRYRPRGGPAAERRHELSSERFEDLLARLARANFFEIDEVPRAGYVADMPSVTVAFRAGERSNEVTIDGRRRASGDLGAILRFFDEIVRAETPAPVSTGD
jgi:hypothetical protein